MSVRKDTENHKKRKLEIFEVQNTNSVADFDFSKKMPDAPVKVFARKNIFESFFFRNLAASLTTGLVFSGIFCFAVYAFATYPDTPYSPGDTLDPGCAPGASNCSVVAPAAYSFGTNNFSGTGTVTANGFLVGTKFAVDENGNITKINNITYSWPANDGDSGQVLSSDGSGTLSWIANGAGSMTYPGAGIAVSTGSAWGSSLTDNHSNWDAGYSHKTTEDAINGLVFVNGAGTYSAKSIGTDIQAYDAELAGLAALSYASGTPFVKMTAAGTFALDTNTYLTSLSGALLATGATTGATSQAQIFTNGVTLSNLTATRVTYAGASGLLSDSAAFTYASGNLTLGAASTATGKLSFKGTTSGTVDITTADAAGTWTMTLPANDGDNGQVLTTNGSGVTSWAAASAPMVYPGAGIAVSTGSAWGSSLTDNHSNWDAGYSHKTTEDAINGLVFVNGAGVYSAKTIGTDVQAYHANLASLAGVANPASAAFLKMGADGAISADTNTYLTSLSGALLATGATTGATSQAQVFTNGVKLSNLTSGRVPYATTDGLLTDSANLTFDGTTLTAAAISTNSAGTGVTMSGASGILTMGGVGNTNNENLTFDFETTANKVAIGTSTGVTDITTTLGFSAGAITGTSFIIGANTISSFVNLDSLADLSYSSGAPFVKMTAAGTFALDTNTYLTSLSGALLATGATTGATSQSQVFTNGVTLSNLTSGRVPYATTAGAITDSADFTYAAGNLTLGAASTSTGKLSFKGTTSGTVDITTGAAAGTWTLTLPTGDGDSGQVLTTDGTGATSWTTVSGMTNPMTTIGDIIYASNTATPATPQRLAGGSTGQILQSNTGAAPSWSTATFPATATSTGSILRADGTNWVSSTATFPNTTTANQILYSSATNVVGGDSGLTFDGTTLTVGSSTEVFTVLDTGKIGISATSPTYDLSFGGDAARTISLERNTTTSGSNLTLSAGGAVSGGTNLNGGVLYIKAGTSTGSGGSSDIFFQTATTGSSGTSDNTPTTKLTIRGSGSVVVGTAALATTATGGFLYIPSSAGTPTGVPVTETGTVPIQYDTTNNALYAYRGGAWHYFAETAGFQIPNYETIDPISGEEIKEGDFVLGMVNGTMPNDNLHGIWVSWNSVKAQLLAEARGELSKTSGTWGSGTVDGVEGVTFLEKVKNILFSLGIEIKDGVTSIATLATQKFSADTASIKQVNIETMQIVDQKTGEIYCTWISDGEWVKVKGECSTINLSQSAAPSVTTSTVNTVPTQTPTAPASISTSTELTQQQLHAIEQAADQAAREASQQTAERISQDTKEKEDKKAQTPNIISVAPLSNINVSYGTAIESAGLPASVTITLDDSTTPSAGIVWDGGTPAYNGNTAGTYIFSGVLNLQAGVANADNLKASVSIIVTAPELEPEEQAQDTTTTSGTDLLTPISDAVSNAASSLLNSVWDFISGILNLGFKKVSSVPVIQKTTAGLVSSVENIFTLFAK